MDLLDDKVLKCLFNPKYMDFELCSEMELVSRPFLVQSRQYQHDLPTFNFDRCCSDEDTAILRKLATRCPNLHSIHNFQFDFPFETDEVSAYRLFPKFQHLTCLQLKCIVDVTKVVMTLMTNIRKLHTLRILKATNIARSFESDYTSSATEIEDNRLKIRGLKSWHIMDSRFDFSKICVPENLKVLHVQIDNNWNTKHNANKFLFCLQKCTSLKELILDLSFKYQSQQDLIWMDRFVNRLDQLPNLNKVFVKVECGSKFLFDWVQNSNLCRHVNELCLEIGKNQQDQSAILQAICKLSELESLTTDAVLDNHESLFNSLQRFQSYKTKKEVYVTQKRLEYIKCGMKILYTKSDELSLPKCDVDIHFVVKSQMDRFDKVPTNFVDLENLLQKYGVNVREIEFDHSSAVDAAKSFDVLIKYCFEVRTIRILNGLSKNLCSLLAERLEKVSHVALPMDASVPNIMQIADTIAPLTLQSRIRKITLRCKPESVVCYRRALQSHPKIMEASKVVRFSILPSSPPTA